jgi:hypothetical protein
MSTRAQTTVQHCKIRRKSSARLAKRGLHAHAVHNVRLREASAARSGWHSNGKPHCGGECSPAPRRKESSRPCPAEAAADGFSRANASALQLCCARCQRASCSATWRASSPCRSASPSWSAQPPLIYLPRAARLRKYREMQGGGGCHSGAGLHAGAPVTTAAIGNSTTADRLSAGRTACDVGNTSNFMVNFHKKSPTTSNRFRPAPILTTAPRNAVCTYLAMIDYQRLRRKRGGFGHWIPT